MTTNTEVEARVQRGIAFLEEQVGQGWKSLIDVAELDLADPHYCVLGHVFADKVDPDADEGPSTGFNWAYDNLLDHSGARAEALGFEVGDEEYDDLQAAWERALTEPTDGGA